MNYRDRIIIVLLALTALAGGIGWIPLETHIILTLCASLLLLVVVPVIPFPQTIEQYVLDLSLTTAYKDKILLINQQKVFPVVLSFYMIVLLIQQTSGISFLISMANLLESILLVITILSGVLLALAPESHPALLKKYSSDRLGLMISIVSTLSLLAVYIVGDQVINTLGLIGVIITILVGSLIFLVGVLLID